MRKTIVFLLLVAVQAIAQNKETDAEKRKRHDALTQEFVTDCATRYNYVTNMKGWQDCLDAGLKVDSTYAYFWQQKAMPYFKARKYEIAMPLIDKAVLYDAQRWQPYRAFMKCIFVKNYKDAILDFEDCKKKFKNGYVMDHTYNFYIAISYLQLNEFAKAEVLLNEYVAEMLLKNGEDWLHPTALFYQGIAKYEQEKYDDAILTFDRALKNYTTFSEAKFYKVFCLMKQGKPEEDYNSLLTEAFQDAASGYKMNEDNTLYETYPYQLRVKN